MEYSKITDYPLQVSKVTLGTMMFGAKCDFNLTERIVERAMEVGINSFDTAALYADGVSEEFIGKIFKNKDREKLFITTKVVKGIDRESIVTGIDESLKRMQMDYVDQYLIHWPVVGMNLTEMCGALNEVVSAGKARRVGVCNFPAYLLASSNAIAAENGWPKLTCNQVAYNLFERGIEVEILPQANLDDILIMAYRPVAVGLLAGKFLPLTPMEVSSRGSADIKVLTWLAQHGRSVENFVELAADMNLEPAQLAVAWTLHNSAVTTTVVGVSSVEQVDSSAIMADIKLTDKEYRRVTDLFNTEVKEEGYQLFPGLRLQYNFSRLRRNPAIATK